MENDILKIVSIILIIISLLILFFLKYEERKERKYIKKCPLCKSKNIIYKKPIFVKIIKECIPKTENSKILSRNFRFYIMGNDYYTIEKKVFDVEYKCLDCQCIFHQELIR